MNETPQVKQNFIELWDYLKGNDNQQLSVANVKVFLCAILNINLPWMKPVETPEQTQED